MLSILYLQYGTYIAATIKPFVRARGQAAFIKFIKFNGVHWTQI